MACSCSAKRKVQFTDPLYKTSQQAVINKQSREPVQISNSYSQYTKMSAAQIRQKLDTSSTTAPDQLCLNCVRKHLGLAKQLLLHKTTRHVFTAAGQIMCASSHLAQTYPNYSCLLQDLALDILRRTPDLFKQLVQVIQLFSQDIKEDTSQYIPLSLSLQQEQLLSLAFVYSLLFIQVTYEEVNKTWATGRLSYLSYKGFRLNSSLEKVQLYRPLWKLIQTMQPYDQNYIAARSYIQSLITQLYVPYQKAAFSKLEQFQQEKEKRLQYMQQLQKEQTVKPAEGLQQQQMMKSLNKVPSIENSNG